ncbi:MAG: glycosyltransferase family 39 protein [Kiritimatiellales bacterium]|nr:glycosyltransferase family 39 protein [Kiritimatiellales bacterium]
MRRYCPIIFWLIIILGIVLRVTDIGIPDIATDEAQFALGASAAQPPVGMSLFALIQAIFGSSIIAVRSVSIVLGIASIGMMFLVARTFLTKESSLFVAAIASIFPSHIIFSRLAYLSVPLCFAWLLVLFVFLKAQKDSRWLIPLFLACVFATFVKTQGLLFPLFLLVGIIFSLIKRREFSIINYQFLIAIILLLSLIPIGLFIATSPGILATLLLYGGNMYGLSNIIERISTLISVWWSILPVLTVFAASSITRMRDIPWPVWVLVFIGTIMGLLLGPAHQYYTTYLVYWSIPITVLLLRWPLPLKGIALVAVILSTLSIVGPRNIMPNARLYHIFQEEGYWNTNAEKINSILKDEDEVIVLGAAGHHIRWYIEPRVLVGDTMDLSDRDGNYLLLIAEEASKIKGARVLYTDEMVSVLKVKN